MNSDGDAAAAPVKCAAWLSTRMPGSREPWPLVVAGPPSSPPPPGRRPLAKLASALSAPPLTEPICRCGAWTPLPWMPVRPAADEQLA